MARSEDPTAQEAMDGDIGDEKALRESLTAKQLRFCEEYIIDSNGARAATVAGYKERSAKEIASENLTKPNVAQYIAYLRSKQSVSTQITAEYVLKGLKKVADRCADEDTFEHAGANRAFELIGKHLGMFKDKIELSGHLDLSGKSDDELREMLKDE